MREEGLTSSLIFSLLRLHTEVQSVTGSPRQLARIYTSRPSPRSFPASKNKGIVEITEPINSCTLPQDSGLGSMVTIRLTTWVNAPVERCFHLATNAEFNDAAGSTGTR